MQNQLIFSPRWEDFLFRIIIKPFIMGDFIKSIEVRWSDLDPNFHVVHSKYYDFGAYCRMAFLIENGLSPITMQQQKMGAPNFLSAAI